MSTSHQPFFASYVHTALALAVFGGFSLGAHIALPLGFGWNLPPFYHIWVQTHGHLQLLGWTGLFIIGVSLYFIPRFVKVPLQGSFLPRASLISIASGIVVRTAAVFIIPYQEPGALSDVLVWILRFAALLELTGVMIYLYILFKLFKKKSVHPDSLTTVKPFFLMMSLGFFLYSVLHFIQVLLFDVTSRMPWNTILIELFMGLVLLPVGFAFSVRTFPLFMQTSPLKYPFQNPGWIYFGATLSILVLYTVPSKSQSVMLLSGILQIIRMAVILKLIFEIKIIQKMILSPHRFLLRYYGRQYVEEREKSTAFNKARPGYYDFGQYGRFELLIYSAYCWLIFFTLLETVSAAGTIFGFRLPYGHDPVRHIFLLGFITLLIMGMAQRMLPGFLHKKGLAYRWIVAAVFWLGNVAVVSRVIPMLIPASWVADYPAVGMGLLYAFGVSGLMMITALLLLWVNLLKTFKNTSLKSIK
jgi:uncharacterized protein involved in response to NO